MKTILAATIALMLATGAQAAGSDDPILDFDTIFDEPSSGPARDFRWSQDGKSLAYRWKDGGKEHLWVLEVDKAEAEAISILEIGDEPFKKVSSFQWAPGDESLLLLSSGDLFLADVAEGSVRRLTQTEAAEEDPKFSPDGTQLAFVREYNLFVMDVASGQERALTTDGRKNEILNGTTDWVYWEEIWGRRATGYWWHPKGSHIAYYQFDDRHVKTYPLVDFTTQYPEIEFQKYPKAGEDNPKVRVGVLELASGETTWMKTGPLESEIDEETKDQDVYLARVDWRPTGDRLAIQRLNRDQNHLDLLLCDPEAGGCSTLLTETAETWVNLTKDLRFLRDNRFLWTTEKDGWRRLHLYSALGSLERDLTPGGWTVVSVDSLSSKGKAVHFTAHRATRLGALHRTAFRYVFSQNGPQRLGPDASWSAMQVAAATGNLVLTSSTASEPPRSVVLDDRGRELATLPSAPIPYDYEELPQWEFLTIPGPTGAVLPAAFLKPAKLNTTRKYPAVMYHYGGPASQVVADRWSNARNLWHMMMAERGFVVLMVDNEASNFFGKEGADRVHRRFGELNLAAQQAGVKYLGSLPFVDTNRVGLWGWSGGGSNTLYSLFNSPGTWRAGVAGAPVTDWRFYDTIWTERYLDHPADNPAGYRDSSAISYAAQLDDKLLIVHGTGDDNVHPQNTIALTRKLVDNGIAFEDAIYPRQKHGFRGRDLRHFYERMTDFFERHLGGRAMPAPPTATFRLDDGLEAPTFKGDGAWLTNLDPENLALGTAPIDIRGSAAVARNLKCSGCVSEFELDFEPRKWLQDLPPENLAPGTAAIDISGSAESAADLECEGCISEAELDFEPITVANLGTKDLSGLDCQGGGRYEDNGDGTVSDCRTGLVWLKEAACADLAGGEDGADTTWSEAIATVAALMSGMCGLSDGSAPGFWRLPKITEWMTTLASARKQGFAKPALTNTRGSAAWSGGEPFMSVQPGLYWSSTEIDEELAWSVSLDFGNVVFGNKLVKRFVWPVRDLE